MKTLKTENIKYIDIIVRAIDEYTTAEKDSLLDLYNIIGKAISEQGEKAFIPYLANVLSENFPTSKGFSVRNLRRMRDFYNIYKKRTDLFEMAKLLSWTVNIVILENCESYDEYEFYLNLAKKENLSKLKLIEAIESSEYKDSIEKISNSAKKLISKTCDFFTCKGIYTAYKEMNIFTGMFEKIIIIINAHMVLKKNFNQRE